MVIRVDSFEFRCWHEVGHATICLHLGGDVEFIEFLDGDTRGHARTRCIVLPESERSVACGGFAAEFFLLKHGLAQQDPSDERDISQVVFHNASADCEDYWGRNLAIGQAFTKEEDEAFMHHAIEAVVPVFDQYLTGMQTLVSELITTKRVEGGKVRELLLMRNYSSDIGTIR
jgi:hypothetical protein